MKDYKLRDFENLFVYYESMKRKLIYRDLHASHTLSIKRDREGEKKFIIMNR